MPESLITYGGLVLFVAGFTTVGFQIVYAIDRAESLCPVWVERLVLLALNVWERALIVLADVLLAAALWLNSPQKGATR